eukprot:403337225
MGQSQIQINLLLVITYWSFVNSTCLQYAFPHTLGGKNGDTMIYGMDMRNDDIVIGGVVYDDSIAPPAGSTGSAFVAMITPGNQYRWAKVLNTQYDQLIGAKFSEEGDKVMAINDRSPFWYVVFDANSGVILIQKKHASSWIDPKIENHSDFYYSDTVQMFALQTSTTGKFLLLSFYQDQYYALQSKDMGLAASLSRSQNTSYFYVGGLQQYKYATLSIVSLNATLIQNYEIQTSPQAGVDAYISKMVVTNYGPLYAGYTNNFASSTDYVGPTFDKQVGFITSFTKDKRCNGIAQYAALETLYFLTITDSSQYLPFNQVDPQIIPSLSFIDPNIVAFSFTTLDAIFFNCSQVDIYQIDAIENVNEYYIIGTLYETKKLEFSNSCEALITYSVYINKKDTNVNQIFVIIFQVTLAEDALAYNQDTNLIQFQSNDRTQKNGVVVITVYGFIKQSWQYITYSITLNLIEDPCESVKITSYNLLNFTYDIALGAGQFINDLNWTQSSPDKGICEQFTYRTTAQNLNDDSQISDWYNLQSGKMISKEMTTVGKYLVTVSAIVKNSTKGEDSDLLNREKYRYYLMIKLNMLENFNLILFHVLLILM